MRYFQWFKHILSRLFSLCIVSQLYGTRYYINKIPWSNNFGKSWLKQSLPHNFIIALLRGCSMLKHYFNIQWKYLREQYSMQFPNFKNLSLQTSFPWTVNGEGHGGQESPQSTFVGVGWVAGIRIILENIKYTVIMTWALYRICMIVALVQPWKRSYIFNTATLSLWSLKYEGGVPRARGGSGNQELILFDYTDFISLFHI